MWLRLPPMLLLIVYTLDALQTDALNRNTHKASSLNYQTICPNYGTKIPKYEIKYPKYETKYPKYETKYPYRQRIYFQNYRGTNVNDRSRNSDRPENYRTTFVYNGFRNFYTPTKDLSYHRDSLNSQILRSTRQTSLRRYKNKGLRDKRKANPKIKIGDSEETNEAFSAQMREPGRMNKTSVDRQMVKSNRSQLNHQPLNYGSRPCFSVKMNHGPPHNYSKKIREKREAGHIDLIENSELDKELTFTCLNRCGEYKDIPCSCSPVCVLYDTCCENITQDCPDVVQEGTTKFAPFMNATILCGAREVFVIHTSPCTPEPSNTSEFVDSPEVPLSNADVLRYILDSPITDMELGLSFVNKQVYDCYRDLLNLTANTMRWSVELRYKQGSTYKDSVGNKLTSVYPYAPSFDLKLLNQHSCVRNVIDSCHADGMSDIGIEKFGLYEKKCRQFTGFVSVYGRHATVYRNRYCAYCSETRKDYLKLFDIPEVHRDTFKFSVLLTISHEGNYILQVSPTSNINMAPTWDTVRCPSLRSFNLGDDDEEVRMKSNNTNDTMAREDIPNNCEIMECGDPRFHLATDGVCKAEYHMLIAFKDNEHGLPPISSAAAHIGDFMTCSLDLILDDETWQYVGKLSTRKVSVVTERRTNETFYFVEMSFVSSIKHDLGALFSFTEESVASNVHKLAVTVKAFKKHRLSNNFINLQYFTDEDDENQISGTGFELTDDMLEGWGQPSYVNILKTKMVTYRGEVKDDKKTTTICFSEFQPLSEPLTVICIEDLEYEGDQAQVDELLGSSCVNHLSPRLSLKSEAVPHRKSPVFSLMLLLFYPEALGF